MVTELLFEELFLDAIKVSGEVKICLRMKTLDLVLWDEWAKSGQPSLHYYL